MHQEYVVTLPHDNYKRYGSKKKIPSMAWAER